MTQDIQLKDRLIVALDMPLKREEYAAAPIIAMHVDTLKGRALCHAILTK